MSENEHKKLTTGYNSIGHLKGSRLGPTDRSIDDAQTKRFTTAFPKDRNYILYVEEKMDGSNCSVIRLNNQIRAVTRTGYDCETSKHEQHRMFHRWVQKHIEKFQHLLPTEGDRCVGEWLALAHGTVYEKLESPYMIFDLFLSNSGAIKYSFNIGFELLCASPHPVRFPTQLRRMLVNEAGLTNVPLVCFQKEPLSIERALKLVNDNAEGVVYRLEIISKKFMYPEPYMIGKVVRQNKEDGKYLKEGKEIWNWKE